MPWPPAAADDLRVWPRRGSWRRSPIPERQLPVPEDDRDHKLLADIARVGWAVLAITEDDDGPGYAFSVGLFHTLGHPEIVLMGLRPETAQRLINLMGEAIRGGQRFEA